MLLFRNFGTSSKRFLIRSLAIFATALDAIVAMNATSVVIKLNTVPVFVDYNMFTVLDFDGLSINGPVCHINTGTASGVVGTGACAGACAATGDISLTPAQIIATAAAAAATVPTAFNSNNLSPDIKTRHQNYLDTTYLMTNRDMQTFPTPLGKMCPILVYLDPLMGTGVVQQPDSNRIITRNGQFFALGDQTQVFKIRSKPF